ncbi:MAG: transglycosylase domain-containing protein [Anaerolineaceae bacterium]|nr:transglycosylase domain-containing protein [Anaerolineaceae bacterium]
MHASRLYKILQRRKNRKKKNQESPSNRAQSFILAAAAICSVVLISAILFGLYQYTLLTSDLPSLEILPMMLDHQSGLLLQPTTFYDRSGEHVLYTMENPGVQRKFMTVNPDAPDHFSPQLIQVTVAMQDPDYWRSPGFRWQKILTPKPLTIPEHLVNDLLLDQEPESIRRTLRMRLLAAQVISEYGWMQVLEWYLNSAYFGHETFGAENAAQLYLGKSSGNLNLSEIALLMALIESPALNPIDAPNAILEQKQRALDKMLIAGAIDRHEYEAAISNPLDFSSPSQAISVLPDEFINLSLRQLSTDFSQHQIERGGLQIITTIDYEIQTQLICTIQTQLKRLENNPNGNANKLDEDCPAALLLPTLPPGTQTFSQSLSGSGVVLSPENGEVLAIVDQTTAQGEKTQALMQPGSLLTPFVAMAGFTRGATPASMFWDIPGMLPEEFSESQNPDGLSHGPVGLRNAIANDYLIAVAQLLQQIGADNVWRLIEPIGLNQLSTPNSSSNILFSGGRVTPLEIAHAYSIFANLGWQKGWLPPTSDQVLPGTILQVKDHAGQSWFTIQEPDQQSVLSPQMSYLIHDILSDEIVRQKSLGFPNPTEIGRPTGVKTGQIASHKQIWTVGYTPEYLTTIWLGLPDDDGGTFPLSYRTSAGIWHAIMQFTLQDKPISDWQIPSGIKQIEVCEPSGLLPTRECSITKNEIFIEGSEPTSYDSLYQHFRINRETGLLATAFTPLELVEEHVYLVPPPEAAEWARLAGLTLPPTGYDSFQAPPENPDAMISSPAQYAYVQGKIQLSGSAKGDDFQSYRLQIGPGLNPESWLQIGIDQTSIIQNGLLGSWDTLTQEDGLHTIRLTVVETDQQINTALTQVVVDNTPPLISIAYPYQNQSIDPGEKEEIILTAQTSDAFGIQTLYWEIDGVLIGTSIQSPYVMPWKIEKGKHQLIVTAKDLAGNQNEAIIEFKIE